MFSVSPERKAAEKLAPQYQETWPKLLLTLEK